MPHTRDRSPWIRRIVIITLLIGLAGGAAYYFSIYPEQLPNWAARTEIGKGLQTTRVYKWQDTSGAWHVSDQPPPGAADFTVQEYNTEDNVLPLPPALQE